jgi:hypothetical protein
MYSSPSPPSATAFEEKCGEQLSQSATESSSKQTDAEQDEPHLREEKEAVEQQRSQSQPPESPKTKAGGGGGRSGKSRVDRL